MASNDFHLVPKKKRSRRHLLESDADQTFPYPGRKIPENELREEDNCPEYTSFWKNRSESVITNGVTNKECREASKENKTFVTKSRNNVAVFSDSAFKKDNRNGLVGCPPASKTEELFGFETKRVFHVRDSDDSGSMSNKSVPNTIEYDSDSVLQSHVDTLKGDKKSKKKCQIKKDVNDVIDEFRTEPCLEVGAKKSDDKENAPQATERKISVDEVNGEILLDDDDAVVKQGNEQSAPSSNIPRGGKKTKKKDRERKEIDDEVERLLQELNADENKAKKSDRKVRGTSETKVSEAPVKTERQLCKSAADDSQQQGDCAVKTAAQKRKVKKDKDKGKRLDKYDLDSFKKKTETCDKSMEKPVSEMSDEVRHEESKSPEGDEESGSVGKGKSGKKGDEPEKKGKCRPGKKQIAAILESLKKAKEKEEKLKKEEEIKQRAAEEADRLRQEKMELEQGNKARKKLKQKEKHEKMKTEGKLPPSKAQKQARARMDATLAAFRSQGIVLPQIGEKKPLGMRLGNCKTLRKRKRLDSHPSFDDSSVASASNVRQKTTSYSSHESSCKDSLSDDPNRNYVKDHLESSFGESLITQSGCSKESNILDEIESSKVIVNTVDVAINAKRKAKTCNEVSVERNSNRMRSPVVCVLGHVDTGKTKILDHIRKTHVQSNEAGGITQQIGATMIPQDALKEKCKMVKSFSSLELKVPGLLVIDTPGHESFRNLRSRGSSICDIAVLVVDIMHGLEPQTIESINLLKERKTPFIVALNKVDRLYCWKSGKDTDIEDVIKSQDRSTEMQFKKKCNEVILQFANQSLNVALYYENKDPKSYVSMVPTSAVSGDGMGNILAMIVELSQTMMSKQLTFSDNLQATVLEVKATIGLGTTIDVILVNGRLREGDTIVLAGHYGAMATQIRSLLMPQPLKELRVKNPYIDYKELEGAQGIKITGKELDKAIAGLPLLVARSVQEVDSLKDEINNIIEETINSIKLSDRGVYVQASTLGSLEALLEYLNASDIPYFGVKIGPVAKKDVTKASTMLQHDSGYPVILAFDVKIERDVQEFADSIGVKIFRADIIYHLFDRFVDYLEDLKKKKREEMKHLAVFPCRLKILPKFVFKFSDPIELGVSVESGTLKEGTPLCVPSRGNLDIGIVTSIEMNHKQVESAKKGQEVCIKIECKQSDCSKTYGKHFNHKDMLVSRITRESIDFCKEHYSDVLQPTDWELISDLEVELHMLDHTADADEAEEEDDDDTVIQNT